MTRFDFGKNWSNFLSTVGEDQIKNAEHSLQELLAMSDLRGLRFLDVGSGSGLFSLAAHRLGARVHSFDNNPKSKRCTEELKLRYCCGESNWDIEVGDVLDVGYLQELGFFDIVYSWGVLHHTGGLWKALENIVGLVKPEGKLWIAIYNDQGWISSYWKIVKKLYNSNVIMKNLIILLHLPYIGVRFLSRLFRGRLALERGMSLWYDLIDWLGGYPFEVAKPHEICQFLNNRDFSLVKKKISGRRHGCNEYLFVKDLKYQAKV